jgi:hypothetical protein
VRLGLHRAARRPGRSVTVVAIVASMTFVVVAADAFWRGGGVATRDQRSATGGYPLVAESSVPVLYDLDTAEGQRPLGLSLPLDLPISGAQFARFRLRPGDEVSRRTLYRPLQPRVLGVRNDFAERGRFAFAAALARTPDEQQNPWLLLDSDLPDDVVPIVADAASLRDVLHVGLGGDLTIRDGRGRRATLRVVAALAGSVFQDAILMGERQFLKLFPDAVGYRYLLIDVEPRWAPALAARLAQELTAFGVELTPTIDRLTEFSRVRNSWLAAWQALTVLGAAIAGLGLSVVVTRDARERRRELAVLHAVGAGRRQLAALVFAEFTWLVACGLVLGTAAAFVALGPTLSGRVGRLPDPALALRIAAATSVALLSALAAVSLALRRPLLSDLRDESH